MNYYTVDLFEMNARHDIQSLQTMIPDSVVMLLHNCSIDSITKFVGIIEEIRYFHSLCKNRGLPGNIFRLDKQTICSYPTNKVDNDLNKLGGDDHEKVYGS